MEGFACLASVCGVIALITSIIALAKISALEEKLRTWRPREIQPFRPKEVPPMPELRPMPSTEVYEPVEEAENVVSQEKEKKKPLVSWTAVETPAEPVQAPPHTQEPVKSPEPVFIPAAQPDTAAEFAEKMKEKLAAQKLSLEVFLGTRGLAIAGSIAVLVGVIIGLKYLYDMKLITPLGRTLIVAGSGIAALVIGQITRKRGYDIVATALAALGFALLYAADFAAFGFYHLIGTNLAFGLAIAITAGGMLYAVRLNEIIVAFISLLGGFLSPVLLSSGENRPNTLFSYLLILIGGAMACAAVRKWRSVSRLSFIGTATLYAAWFHKWYTPFVYDNSMPDQLAVAVTWLSVFFIIYLVMPVLYELVKREVAHKGDVLLMLTNATFSYIYFHQILFSQHRTYLALAAACLGIAHLGLMAIVHARCPNDKALKLSLLVLGLFFVTIAIPLYLKMYAVALAWTGEGLVLTFVALRYRSKIVQLASFAAFTLAIITLGKYLPLHHTEFTLIFNNAFGTWCFVAAACFVAHLFYRREKEYSLVFSSQIFAQILYCFSLALILIAACLEWHDYTDYNLVIPDQAAFLKGLLILLSAFMVLYLLPKFRPQGALPYVVSCILAVATLVTALASVSDFYKGSFKLILNNSFGSIAFAAVMYYVVHLFYRRQKEDSLPFSMQILSQIFYCLSLAMLLLAACMDWYGHTTYNLASHHHTIFIKGLLMILASFMIFYLMPRLRPQGLLPYIASGILAIITFAVTLGSISDFYQGPFTFFANSSFGSVVFVAAAYYIAHLMHRNANIRLRSDESWYFAQILFCMSMIILMAAAIMEWYGHTRFNLIAAGDNLYVKWFAKGMVIIGSVFVIGLLIPGFRPKGTLPVVLATILTAGTSIGTLTAFPDFYGGSFTIFANAPFAISLAPLATLAIAARLLYGSSEFQLRERRQIACGYGLAMIFFLWVLLTEEIYVYWNYPGHPLLGSVIDKGQMWISIMWAIYAAAIIGIGLWRKFVTLRYIGLGFFTIVLIKVFIFDMSTLEKIYRIAGFIVLGLVLIGVSYLYQYLRKTGFFEKSLPGRESA